MVIIVLQKVVVCLQIVTRQKNIVMKIFVNMCLKYLPFLNSHELKKKKSAIVRKYVRINHLFEMFSI